MSAPEGYSCFVSREHCNSTENRTNYFARKETLNVLLYSDEENSKQPSQNNYILSTKQFYFETV